MARSCFLEASRWNCLKNRLVGRVGAHGCAPLQALIKIKWVLSPSSVVADPCIDYLRPMVLRDVADDIGMHESTVSRVVSNKYIHTPRGLFPMKFFFHSGIDREYGEDISSLTVKRKIKKLIGAEEPKRPLSDSELMRILNREGIHIARRTVAKYRDELAIPSSTDRKQIF